MGKQVGYLVHPALPGKGIQSKSYRLSPSVISRGSHGRLVQDIENRIGIPVMVNAMQVLQSRTYILSTPRAGVNLQWANSSLS